VDVIPNVPITTESMSSTDVSSFTAMSTREDKLLLIETHDVFNLSKDGGNMCCNYAVECQVTAASPNKSFNETSQSNSP
jgi:hypothetical protein